ncbi:MAG: sigma-70 family RNA polymerase sigma factor [Clostridia bacterium]|nr:sigma-70 family RNA polymerase sigma factor [Clostridia bacterium]
MERIRERFERDYAETFALLRRLAVRKTDIPADAEDVLQSTYLKYYAYLERGGGTHVKEPAAYLTGMLKKELFRYRLFGSRRKTEPLKETLADGACTEAEAMDRLAVAEVAECLKAEPAISRKIFSLYYGCGMKTAEIAAALGMKDAAVRQRLNRTRARIRREIGQGTDGE